MTDGEVIEQEAPVISNPFAMDWGTSPKVVEPAPVAEKEVKPDAIAEAIAEHPEKPIVEVKVPAEAIQSIQEPLKFANEESEKIYNLFLAGDADKALDIYAEQKKLKNADKLLPADVIKLNLQYQNKDFTPDEVNDLFLDTYAMPEKPEQEISELDEEFLERTKKYSKEVERIENRIKRDAKPATAELLKLHKEIVLPDIQPQQPKLTEPTQEELDAQKKEVDIFLQSIDTSLDKFNGYKATFKDEEVELPIAYSLTKEEKSKIQPLIALSNSNAGEFMRTIGWIDEKGQIDTSKMAEDLPFILDKKSVIQKMVTETGNQRRAASIKATKNIDYSGNQRSSGGGLGPTGQELEQGMVSHFFGS